MNEQSYICMCTRPVCTYVCVHVCMHVCTLVRMYVCMYMYLYVCICMYMYVCICMYMYVCVPMLTQASRLGEGAARDDERAEPYRRHPLH